MTPAPDEQQPTAPDSSGPVTAEPGTSDPEATGSTGPETTAPGMNDASAADALEEAAQQPPPGAGPTGSGPEWTPEAVGETADVPQQAQESGGEVTDQAAERAAGGVDDDQVSGTADLAASDALILAQTELAERTLDLQRLQAEFLNYKRRVERDRELVKQNATFSVLSGLLPVLDDIDRAREHGELEGGFKAIADSLERIVAGLGLTKFGAKGDAFDPNLHEALMHGHSPDVTFTQVDVVAHAGYRIGDRVLRAARVTVLDPES